MLRPLLHTTSILFLVGYIGGSSSAWQYTDDRVGLANASSDDVLADQEFAVLGQAPTHQLITEADILEMNIAQSALRYDYEDIQAQLVQRGTRERRQARMPSQAWDDVMSNFRLYLRDMPINKTAPQDTVTCTLDFAAIAAAAEKGKAGLWGIQMLDAWGKPTNRLLKSNPSDYGDFDGCLNLVPKANFTTQYCSSRANVKQLGTVTLPKAIGVNLGLCIPSSCSGNDAGGIINAFLKTQADVDVSYGGVGCAPHDQPLTAKAQSVIVVLAFIAAFIAIGTLYDILIVRRYLRELTCQPEPETVSVVTRLDDGQIGGSYTESTSLPSARGEYQSLGGSQPLPDHKPGWIGKFFLSFSVRSNGAKLLSTKSGASSIGCINGIRFYSMAWVVLGHSFSMAGQGKTNQAEYQYWSTKDWTFQAILNALVSVDTFFVLSGLLVTYLALKELDKVKTWSGYGGFLGKFYFHRYWRLTPPYMLVMMTYIPLFKYIGDGPFWAWNGLEGSDECEDTWWTNMLYINNVERSKQMCMGWSWYLANDMQFFVISPFILLPLHFFKAKALIIPGAIVLTNFIWTGVLSHDNGFGPNTGPDFFDLYYIKPWNRIGPYMIGMMTGWLLYKTHCKQRMRPSVAVFGWVAATVVGFLVLYGLYDHTNGNPMSDGAADLYNAVHRTAWGMVVSWVIYACATGYGGPIDTFLSWNWLLPLSRMTYCAYLVHPLVINYYFLIQRQPVYIDTNIMIFAFLAILWMTFFLAFIASMAFESPFLGLEKLLFVFFGWVGKAVKTTHAPNYGGNAAKPKPAPKPQKEEYTVRYSSISNHQQ